MAGKWIILSALCVTLAVPYTSEEYATDPKEMEAELESLISRTPPPHQVLESETTSIEHQFIKEEPDLVVQTTYYPSVTTTTTQSVVVPESNTATPRSVEVDMTENVAMFLEENAETSTTSVNTQDYAQSTDIPTNTTPTTRNETESTKRTTYTTINTQPLDGTTSQSDDGYQPIATSNIIYDRTTPHSNEFKSEELISTTTTDDISTTFEIDMVNSQNIPTLETDNFTKITSFSGSSDRPLLTNIPSSTITDTNSPLNTSQLLTTQYSERVPSTAITSSLDEFPTTTEEDGLTLSGIGSDKSQSGYTTVVGTDIFETRITATENTEKSVSDLNNTNTTNAKINSTTEGTNFVSTETVQDEIVSRTSSIIRSTTEPLAPSVQVNVSESVALNTLCNNDHTCTNNQVCVFKNGACVCVSNMKTSSNVQICGNLTAHSVVIPSNKSVSIVQNVGDTKGDLDLAGHREFVNSFFIKKVSELSNRQTSRNVVTVSFSPAMEIVEWFQSYDWRFRKYVSVALTTCMRHTMVNNITRIFTPSDIVYLAQSLRHDELAFNVSFLARNPWDEVNNIFIYNTIVVACLNEGRKHCETELQLTVNTIEAALPKRLLGDRTVSVAGLSANTVKLMFIGAMTSFVLVILSLLVFTIKCRQARGRFDPRSGLYRHPRVLTRSPGDGHNLATDEQCQQDEGKRKEAENGDTWVVPLEEVEAMEREIKSEKEEDSKV